MASDKIRLVLQVGSKLCIAVESAKVPLLVKKSQESCAFEEGTYLRYPAMCRCCHKVSNGINLISLTCKIVLFFCGK